MYIFLSLVFRCAHYYINCNSKKIGNFVENYYRGNEKYYIHAIYILYCLFSHIKHLIIQEQKIVPQAYFEFPSLSYI